MQRNPESDGGEHGSEDGAVRPQTLMLNMLGRYVLGRQVAVSAASVIEVFARVNVGEHAARSTLARMVNRGMLTRQRHGRAMYFGLTAQAERILRDGEDRIWRRGAVNRDWDGYWTLLGFSLPESWQRQRHELRSQLTWAGFGPLFNGLWIAPGKLDVTDLVGSLGLESHVKAFYAQSVPGTDAAKMVQETWDLDAVATRYRSFLTRWHDPDTPPRHGDPLAVKLLLACDWLQVIRADPRLPSAHLPADWPAAEAEALFVRVDKDVDEAAHAIAQEILDLRPSAGERS
ncbi:PaaX family transcriptional regulator C-terminal domain-containing protein [Actinospica durhamensis]|uniref:PaaX family transcriptional regulator n=1 Tax=Actinospica durhamensis TaxID=1508375 RepID=UPI0027DCD19A|nr:PaaX family transcriptional regulator C-terminal domain-containing protein [Actinospica durhamensis]